MRGLTEGDKMKAEQIYEQFSKDDLATMVGDAQRVREADRELIKDLLAACETALALFNDPNAEAPEADQVIMVLENAIAKARG